MARVEALALSGAQAVGFRDRLAMAFALGEHAHEAWYPVPILVRNEVIVPCILNGHKMPVRLNRWLYFAERGLNELSPGHNPTEVGPRLIVGIDPVARSAETIGIDLVAPLSWLTEKAPQDELIQLRTKVNLHAPLNVFNDDGTVGQRPVGQYDRSDIIDALSIAIGEMGAAAGGGKEKNQLKTRFVVDTHAWRKTLDYLVNMSGQLDMIIAESAARDEFEYLLQVHRGRIALIVENSFTQGAKKGNYQHELVDFLDEIRNGEYETWDGLLVGARDVSVVMKEQVYGVLEKIGRLFVRHGASSDEVADTWIRRSGSLTDRLDALGPIGVMTIDRVIEEVAMAQVAAMVARGDAAKAEAFAQYLAARLDAAAITARSWSSTAVRAIGVPIAGVAGVLSGAKGVVDNVRGRLSLPQSTQTITNPSRQISSSDYSSK